MKLNCTIARFENNQRYLLIPAIQAQPLLKDGNKRVMCRINEQHLLHAALLPRKDGDFLIVLSAAVCKKLKLEAGMQVKLELEIDTSPYQFEMPAALQEVLLTDPDADRIFHSLTPGNQRSLIHLVNLLKSTDKQIERALLIAEKLKMGIRRAPDMLKKTS